MIRMSGLVGFLILTTLLLLSACKYDTSSETDLIYSINKKINEQIKYVSDFEQFGEEERWQFPLETLANGKGDCEDYVILKGYMLSNLTPPRHSSIVFMVSYDQIGKHNAVGHVMLKDLKTGLYLDNNTDSLLTYNDVIQNYVVIEEILFEEFK